MEILLAQVNLGLLINMHIKYFGFLILVLIIHFNNSFAQGRRNNWLIGYDSGTSPVTTCERARIYFNSGNPVIQQQLTRKINFKSTEANISDSNGNLLFCSNGVWIADAFGDTMQNGTGLNPGQLVNASSGHCLNMMNANLILPFPGDSNKYILFHTVANYNVFLAASELFYSVIDVSLNNGLGAVTLKNQIAFSDTLMWSIAACKHANGRDWWVLMVKDSSEIIYKVLLTPNGITSISTQHLPGAFNFHTSVGQSCFSPDGKKFAYSSTYTDTVGGPHTFNEIKLFDFDRCSGMLSNTKLFSRISYYIGFGVCFSPNSKFLYTCTSQYIFQMNLDSINPQVDTVAVNDGFMSPISPLQSDFLLMYLASNNKIYITSGNSVIDIHYINYPDSAGLDCDVRQHSLHLPCFNWRSIPNHPNYELGADSGSVCDTLQLGVKNAAFRIQHEVIRINPNPASNYFYINYNLPVNDCALFVLYDSFGKEVLRKNLYGTMQTLLVSDFELDNGLYYYIATVRNKIIDRGKLVIVK